MTNPIMLGSPPCAIERTMSLVWDNGRADTNSRMPWGIWSVEKKVLHKNDIGMMM